MLPNDEYNVFIEKMVNEGKGIARINSFPVFIDNVCPEDFVRIKINTVNKKYASAEIIEIIDPSRSRVKPVCAIHNICGSCSWQHIEYEEQLKQKQNIVFETLKNITGKDFHILPVIPSPKLKEYRCKVQYPVSQKKSGRLISGYYKKNTHELINIKYCPMQNSLISEIMEFIKENAQLLNISGYIEKTNSGLLRHIIFRQSSDMSQILVILVLNSNQITREIYKLSDILMKNYPVITGVCANFNIKKTNVILGQKTEAILGNSSYFENLSSLKYKISANSFFQVNPFCAEKIFNIVKNLIDDRIKMPSILDAYSGVSSFGIWLSSIASEVVCIEEVESASGDAIENVKLNKCSNVKIINGDAGLQFKKLIDSNIKFDVSVIDPPRKGCDETAINNLISLTKKYIVYVSCNVSTLARDLKILMSNSFEPEIIQPVDMFPNTYHIETIVLLKKKK